MSELAFLSPEIENEFENVEEEPETQDNITSLVDSNVSRQCQRGQHSIPKDTDEARHVESVEICQKTVNPHVRVNSENFKIQRVIGKGGYGKVFLVQKVDGVDKGKLYAMKVLKKAMLICNEKDKAHTVSERNILQMLRHPFLVRLHYAFQNHSNLYIVLEYCPGGELFNYLEREGALLENAACFYTSEIILAIEHLHSLGIIYRDLKSENVLLDRQGHVKLTDFGLSKEGVCTTNTFCGTIEYMAPEIIKCEGHGKAVDWWSLGTLLYDMLSGGPPFSQEESREATTRKILTAPLKFPPSFSPEVVSLIRGLLKRDPKERLGSKGDAEEVKQHKFFWRHEINWSDVLHKRLKPPFRPHLVCENDVSMFDPSFTRLQPVVSPVDSTRTIPPDMFQGFSYVAPSVCEDSLRDALPETHSVHHRRHYGSRGALSAGRLRRIETGTTDWHGKRNHLLPNGTNKFPLAVDFQLSSDASVSQLKVSDKQDNCQPPLNSDDLSKASEAMTEHDNAKAITKEDAEVDQDVDDEMIETVATDMDEDDDDDEEPDEENIPGAKQINIQSPTFFPCTNGKLFSGIPNANHSYAGQQSTIPTVNKDGMKVSKDSSANQLERFNSRNEVTSLTDMKALARYTPNGKTNIANIPKVTKVETVSTLNRPGYSVSNSTLMSINSSASVRTGTTGNRRWAGATANPAINANTSGGSSNAKCCVM